MPSSVNGIGTGLIAASRKRKNDGQTQFDAIEAGMFVYLPLVPYKALHVLDIQGQQYRFVPLRMSSRLVLRAFLNRWGNALAIFGGIASGAGAYAMSTMTRPMNDTDRRFVTAFAVLFIVGIACKIAWWFLTWKDERIKNLVGPHGQGTSDPWDWPPAQAEAVTKAILQQESLPSLIAVAQKAVRAGNRSLAAVCLRLALRDRNDFEAQDMLDRLLAE
jgi:hypothetical protein